jgi:predicted dehydrogenase
MAMDDRKLGVAIHGAGVVAHAHAASWLRNPHARIVSVSSRRRETAQRFAEELGLDCRVTDDYASVLADPDVDIVNISGPNHVHAEQAIAAAEAGKHLLVEKPIALTMDDNRAVRDAVARAGVKSIVSFVCRWHPEVQIIKNLVRQGAIGELFYAEVDYWHNIGPTHHAWAMHSRVATGGSAMLLAGCHGADLLRYLVGDEAVEVSARGNNPHQRYEYDANVVALVKFRRGLVAKSSVLLDCAMPYTFNIDLAGTEGTIRDNRLWSKRLLPGQTGWTTVSTSLLDTADVHHHPFDAEIGQLVDSILTGKESFGTVADAYLSHELCMAIDRSLAAEGRPIRLPLGV